MIVRQCANPINPAGRCFVPIFVNCPSCRNRVKAPNTLAGKTMDCPWCKCLVPVPQSTGRLADEDEPAAPSRAPAGARYLHSKLVPGEWIIYAAKLHWFMFA